MSDSSSEEMDSVSSDGSETKIGFTVSERATCMKIKLAENIIAYTEKHKLIRETEALTCENSLIEEVMSNYVIVKKIISNLPWQDKMLCKQVCSMWYSAVQTLQKEQQNPIDYVLEVSKSLKNGLKFKKSGEFLTEPLAVMTFTNMLSFNTQANCTYIKSNQCKPSCSDDHCLIDVVQNNIMAPKNCMLSVRASYLSFMPLSSSPTYEHMLTNHMFSCINRIICGIIIPKIQDVEFSMINIKPVVNMQKDFFGVLDKLAETRIFKGVLAYATEDYLLHSVEDIIFLNYFKDLQPDIPYALGGCIVLDTLSDSSDIDTIVENSKNGDDFVSSNLLTIGLFTVPKDANGCNFDMYSLIIESSEWTKAKIGETINKFAKKVPVFEHSVALKLSCVGRDQKHNLEQELFRAAFPRTRLIGCFGNGELGIDHPKKQPIETIKKAPIKRLKEDSGPQFGIMYSYSTVFVYIGWGRILSPSNSS